jgi:hypothetical protein
MMPVTDSSIYAKVGFSLFTVLAMLGVLAMFRGGAFALQRISGRLQRRWRCAIRRLPDRRHVWAGAAQSPEGAAHRPWRLLDIAALGHKLAQPPQALADCDADAKLQARDVTLHIRAADSRRRKGIGDLQAAGRGGAATGDLRVRRGDGPVLVAWLARPELPGPHGRLTRSSVHQSLGHYTKRLCALSSAG